MLSLRPDPREGEREQDPRHGAERQEGTLSPDPLQPQSFLEYPESVLSCVGVSGGRSKTFTFCLYRTRDSRRVVRSPTSN